MPPMETPTAFGDLPEPQAPSPLAARRRLLGWSASSLPVAPLLVAGMILGPEGLAVLSSSALAAVDPAIPVALAALGILIGLETGAARVDGHPGIGVGAIHALSTTAIVAGGLFGVMTLDPAAASAPWLFAILCGVCAASSLTLPGRSLPEPRRQTDALVEAEVAVAIVAGAAVLAYARRQSAAGAAVLLAQIVGVVAVLAAAGWLLTRRTSSTTERRVFVMAALLLVGGAADFLASSPLFGGLCAGLLWQRLGGNSRAVLHAETLYVQHPLVVLVLLVAGARAQLTPTVLSLTVVYLGLRTVARHVGGTAMQRLQPASTPALRLELLAPGVFGVAFALNAARAVAPDAGGGPSVLSVVVLGTLLSDVVARLVASREAA